MKFALLRLYDGGGLARFEIIKCKEDDLEDKIVEFEEDCARSNEGTFVAILEEKEIKRIAKAMEK